MTNIGIIGCGDIFGRYLKGLAFFEHLKVTWCADLDPAVAAKAAAEHSIPNHGSPEQLLADPEVTVVVNITPPAAHGAVTRAIVAAGKHVYVEKPLDVTVAAAVEQLGAVHEAGVRIGVAPDTFLGSGAQTARAAIDRGEIGEAVGATLFVTHSKAETWHPNPGFLFQPGGGPVLDLGPYYITTLVNTLGPVSEVFGRERLGAPHRVVTAPNRTVDRIEVKTPTHAAAVLTLESGVLVTAMMSFDVWDHHLPFFEIYGTEGTLSVPDPDQFDGPVRVKRHDDIEWRTIEPVFAPLFGADLYDQLQRGPGVADLVASLDEAPHRANPDLALHVLEVLEAIGAGRSVHIRHTCARPASVVNEGN